MYYDNLKALLAANPNFKVLLNSNAVIAFYNDGKIVVVPDQQNTTTIQSPDCYLKALTTGGPGGPQGYFVGKVNETARAFMALIPTTNTYKTWRFGAPRGAIVDLNGRTSKIPCIGIEGMFDDEMTMIAIEVATKPNDTDTIEISDAFEADVEQPPAVEQSPAVTAHAMC